MQEWWMKSRLLVGLSSKNIGGSWNPCCCCCWFLLKLFNCQKRVARFEKGATFFLTLKPPNRAKTLRFFLMGNFFFQRNWCFKIRYNGICSMFFVLLSMQKEDGPFRGAQCNPFTKNCFCSPLSRQWTGVARTWELVHWPVIRNEQVPHDDCPSQCFVEMWRHKHKDFTPRWHPARQMAIFKQIRAMDMQQLTRGLHSAPQKIFQLTCMSFREGGVCAGICCTMAPSQSDSWWSMSRSMK